MIFPSFPVSENLLIYDIKTFFTRDCVPDFVFPGETHNFWECLYVLSGSVCASGDGRVYNLTRGNMICHKPMEMHKFYTDSPSGAKILVFSFSAEGPAADKLRDKVFLLAESERSLLELMLAFAKSSPPVSDCGMTDYLHDPTAEYTEVIAAYIKLLLLTLAGKGESEKASNDPEAFVFSEAVEFMEKNLAENLKISEIAAHCNTSVTVLKRIFSKYSGVGIHKYFLKLKLKRASALLSDGRTVTETADILGFSDQGYFSKAFRRETGASPSELKASCFKKFK